MSKAAIIRGLRRTLGAEQADLASATVASPDRTNASLRAAGAGAGAARRPITTPTAYAATLPAFAPGARGAALRQNQGIANQPRIVDLSPPPKRTFAQSSNRLVLAAASPIAIPTAGAPSPSDVRRRAAPAPAPPGGAQSPACEPWPEATAPATVAAPLPDLRSTVKIDRPRQTDRRTVIYPARGFAIGAMIGSVLMLVILVVQSDIVRDSRTWLATALRGLKTSGSEAVLEEAEPASGSTKPVVANEQNPATARPADPVAGGTVSPAPVVGVPPTPAPVRPRSMAVPAVPDAIELPAQDEASPVDNAAAPSAKPPSPTRAAPRKNGTERTRIPLEGAGDDHEPLGEEAMANPPSNDTTRA